MGNGEITKKPKGGLHPEYRFPHMEMKKIEQDDDKREFIGKALHNILEVSRAFDTPPQTEEELCDRLNWFFQTCQETNQLPTVEKMCLALSMPRSTVFDWESGRTRGLGPATSDILKKAKNLIASLDAELAQEGKIQPVVYMFRAKNYYGMKDQQDVVVTPNQGENFQDRATIEAKYAELPSPDEEI